MYTLHVISLKFTGNPCKISPKISLLHSFPTSNAGSPHSIPVKQIPCKYYNGNQSVDISKLQGLQGILAIPMLIKCMLQGTLCDTGIPCTFYGENICSVLEFIM